jgi:hypothetical protein
MADEKLKHEDLEEQRAELLPEREAMSILPVPGAELDPFPGLEKLPERDEPTPA